MKTSRRALLQAISASPLLTLSLPVVAEDKYWRAVRAINAQTGHAALDSPPTAEFSPLSPFDAAFVRALTKAWVRRFDNSWVMDMVWGFTVFNQKGVIAVEDEPGSEVDMNLVDAIERHYGLVA